MKFSDLRIPTPPQVLAKIIETASDPKVSVAKLGKLTTQDPAFATEVLRMVNSSFYRREVPVNSVMRAVAVIGSRELRNVALCTAARNCVDARELGSFDLRRFWEDSLRRAVAGQLLSEKLEWGDPMEAFTVGLLQDLGVLTLMLNKPDLASEWMKYVDDDPLERRQREKEIFEASHDELGKVLAKRWGLPPELSLPMIHHHEMGDIAEEHKQRCQLAYLSEMLAGVFTRADKRVGLEEARKALKDVASLSGEECDELAGALGPRVEECAQSMGMDVEAQPSLQAIVMAANQSLAEMNLNYEELVKILEETLQKLEKTLAEKRDLAAQLEARNKELNTLSLTDALTGLPNRRAFSSRISSEVSQLSRQGGQLTLLIGDIDHFKIFNDTHGHDFGDEVLRTVAVSLSENVRRSDLVARIGGEEFGVLLPNTDKKGAISVAEKLLEAVRSRELTTPKHEKTNVTISLGLARLCGPFKGSFTEDAVINRLYRAADANLYSSKHGGRDQVTASEEDVPWEEEEKQEQAA